MAASLALTPSLAGSQLMVYTLKKSYRVGEVVTIVVKTKPWAEVGVEVVNPFMKVIFADEEIANLTGVAVFKVLALPKLWSAGNYTVFAAIKGVCNFTTFTVLPPA